MPYFYHLLNSEKRLLLPSRLLESRKHSQNVRLLYLTWLGPCGFFCAKLSIFSPSGKLHDKCYSVFKQTISVYVVGYSIGKVEPNKARMIYCSMEHVQLGFYVCTRWWPKILSWATSSGSQSLEKISFYKASFWRSKKYWHAKSSRAVAEVV